jgi:hypothetical protein
MATQTTFSDAEQRAIYQGEGFKLGREIALSWTKTLGPHAPVALASAVDAIAQIIVAHVGVDAATTFLDELAKSLRKGDGETVAGGSTQHGQTPQTSTVNHTTGTPQ